MKALLLYLGFILAITSCHQSQSTPYLRPVDLPENHPPAQQLLWQAHGLELVNPGGKPQENLSYAMVQLPEGTPLDTSLALTQAEPPYGQGRYYLFAIKGPEDLLKLSEMSHVWHKGACAKIQYLNTAMHFRPLSEARYSPVYGPGLQLPEVKDLLTAVDVDRVAAHITELESLGSRLYSAAQGAASQKVYDLFAVLLAQNNLSGHSLEFYNHGNYPQSSVIYRITGQSQPDQVVILGAHLDSISHRDSSSLAPGADDDASGIAGLLEILRIIIAQKLSFERSIEFHAYGLEEIGLVGSRDIAESYFQAQKQVVAMSQMDMISYYDASEGPKIYMVATDTDPYLTYAFGELMQSYLDDNFAVATLSAGTSDHKSWHDLGYPVVFSFENPDAYNPYIHTSRDSSSRISDFQLAQRIIQLNLAYLGHYAGLVSGRESYVSQSQAKAKRQDGESVLKIALWQSQTESGYDLAVAAPADIQKIHLCLSREAQPFACQKARVILNKLEGSLAGQSYFESAVAMSLSADEVYRVLAYDAQGRLSYYRTIRFQE